MKRLIIAVLCAIMCLELNAGDKVRFMPAWLPQAQFAGYYAAFENGFFEEEGLDVEIVHVGLYSSKGAVQCLLDGDVDFIVSSPVQALIARETLGADFKNVLQVTQSTGLMIVSHTPIPDAKSLEGLNIGRWKTGISEICDICCKTNGITVNWTPFLNGINLFLSGAVDATLVQSYNEYYQLIEAMGYIPEDYCFRFADHGFDIPEDGVYVTAEYLEKNEETADKFCKAVMKGWLWAFDNREKMIDIVMDKAEEFGIRTSRYHQHCMLDEMEKLLKDKITGEITFEPIQQDMFEFLIKSLLELGYISGSVSYSDIVR